MKKLLSVLGIAVLGFYSSAQAVTVQLSDVMVAQLVATPVTTSAQVGLDLIDWKVGDRAEYNLSLGFLGGGTMVQTVTKDEGTALWMQQEMDLKVQKQKIEALIRKSDGKVLKLLLNGQEQKVPDERPEIISQEYTEITVPAGTFKCLHIVAKTKQVSKIELWANPKETVMDGNIKQIISTGFGMEITSELVKFQHGA